MKRHANRNRPTRGGAVLDLFGPSGVLRPRDLAPHGIPRVHLRRLVEKGLVERIGRGLYVRRGSAVSEHHGVVAACKRVPDGVVCLLSALVFHGLTTQGPAEVWMAIGPSARTPLADGIPLRIVRMSRESREAGVDVRTIDGVPVRVFGAAKTVADCFKFRNRVGLDVALEALRDFRRTRRGGFDELWRFARVCRVANVMRPYMEAIA